MALALLLVGILITVSALKGTEHELASKLEGDLTGADGFIVWFGAILTLGAIGYIPGLQQVTRWMIALVCVVIVLSNQGIVDNLFQAFQMTDQTGAAPAAAPPAPAPATPAAAPAASSSSSGGSGILGAIGSIAGGLLGSIF